MVTSPVTRAASAAHSKSSKSLLCDAGLGDAQSISAGMLLDLWHLLSLDAPTVAVLWSCAFAHSALVGVPWLSSIMLAFATWLLYVADRLLDGLQASRADALQIRHHFHRHHRIALLAAAVPAMVVLAWFVITRMDPAPRREDFTLAGCAALYLLGVHLPFPQFRFPKEVVVGVIFAAACVVPVWSRHPAARPMLLVPGGLFAALCSTNCIAIEHWEGPVLRARSHSVIHWIGGHLRGACLALSAASIAAAALAIPEHRSYAVLDLSIAISALLILWLHTCRERFTLLRLRSAADAVLLTPVIFLGANTVLLLILHLHLK